ncbi:MAG: hypothetical protein Q8R40_05780 [bacterium]|nr:hypothetical protein [bacterium]
MMNKQKEAQGQDSLRTLYSVHYERTGSPGVVYSVDWQDGQWTQNDKEYTEVKWYDRPFDKAAYYALLDHFGLERWEKDIPMQLIVTMCPKNLECFRRMKEASDQDLPKKFMQSDGYGRHLPSEYTR